jgi:RNA polymerase sigma-70 factor, ECF subfamily
MDEMTLIRATQTGDLDAFNDLVLAYQDTAFKQAQWILGESEPAEDVTQDAFIAAFRHLHTFRGGSFKAWLLRIVTHLCYHELRRRKRRPTVPLYPVNCDDEEVESPYWLIDRGESLEDGVVNSELSRLIRRYLLRLPIGLREVVVLVDMQGLDYVEAAQVLDIPLGTVKSRLARARIKLRNQMQGEGIPALMLSYA